MKNLVDICGISKTCDKPKSYPSCKKEEKKLAYYRYKVGKWTKRLNECREVDASIMPYEL
jgi:hypothetical protein